VKYSEIIDSGISAIASEFPENVPLKRKTAVLLLLDDPFLADYLRKKYGVEKVAQLTKQVNRVKKEFRANIAYAINNKRSRWVEELA